MSIKSGTLLSILAVAILAAAGFKMGEARGGQPQIAPPAVYVTGSQVTVYYPAERKIYVYSQLGGNCVHVYTLTTPGGELKRENCR